MISEVATIGDKLELRKISNAIDNNRKERLYTSQILDITADGLVNIAMPIEKGRIIPLNIGDKYQLFIYSSKGLYQCNMVITNRYKDNNIHMLTIQILSELDKFQRRQFYRLDCILDISYHCINELEVKLREKFMRNDFTNEAEKSACKNKLNELEKEYGQGIVTDLSGGGAKFISDKLLDNGLPLIMSFNLQIGGTTKELQLQGNVISSVKMLNRIGYYEHRVKYVDILKEERETIIKFIFEEERRLRKREKELK
jgi:c-di-GMP-binding flagellar brake protein YcgR